MTTRGKLLISAMIVLSSASMPWQGAQALDGKSSGAPSVSMDEVARQIRQLKSWQILEAQSKQEESGTQYFRFKLLRNDGKVKVINIDPNNPNLRRLE